MKPEIIKTIPHEAGIYKFFNNKNVLIYVGKAKDLKKRTSSYFTKSHHNNKTRKLVSEIVQIEYVVVNNEFEALLLENNLIKSNQPKYNILLKDDKSYPYICITKERFPRIQSIRNPDFSKGEFYGPYTSVVAMNNLLELINKLFLIRSCKYNLSKQNVANRKYSVCLEYHIGNCLGPCEGLQEEKNYLSQIDQAKSILKGKLSFVKNYLTNIMLELSSELKFEEANLVKTKLNLLSKFQSKSVVVSTKLNDIHVITLTSVEQIFFLNYMKVTSGSITKSENRQIKSKLDETESQVLATIMPEFIELEQDNKAIDIITNIIPPELPRPIHITAPIIGDKKQLVDLSLKNAFELRKKYVERLNNNLPPFHRILKQLQEDLKLKQLPLHIECFDNSNLQGTNPVASMVCFKNAKPSKKDYRKFNIKTVDGPNDFASMTEIVERRYKRLAEEKLSFPNLILIDGGKGQLSAAVEALKKLNLYSKIPAIGIAKRLEEIYVPNDSIPIHINKKSGSLKLLQQLRDEAHRFAITFHRSKRSKGSLNTWLETIESIGPSTINKLLKHFKSVTKIKDSTEEELQQIIGAAKTESIMRAIKKSD